jgi:hypothetical protein
MSWNYRRGPLGPALVGNPKMGRGPRVTQSSTNPVTQAVDNVLGAPSTSSAPISGLAQILASLMANAGKGPAPISPLGAVVNAPLESPGFDPFTYGQSSGEANFFHMTPDAKFAPISAMPGLGAPSPVTPKPTTPAKPTTPTKKKKD